MDTETILKELVTAAHHDLAKTQAILAQHPTLLNAQYDWGDNDLETPLEAAAHMGDRRIAEWLLEQGAPLIICAAAMLGRTEAVREMLHADAALANARGGHGIPLMFHAAMSGDVELAALLKAHGCREGYDDALHGAIDFGHEAMVKWLLANGATNLNVPNFAGKSPLTAALKSGHSGIVEMLRAHGALEAAQP
jgi:uncharacterized protein